MNKVVVFSLDIAFIQQLEICKATIDAYETQYTKPK